MKKTALFFLLAVCAAVPVRAQYDTGYTYFGQNKIAYDHFAWETYKSTHFTIWFYKKEEVTLGKVASYAESAYDDISRALNFQIPKSINLIYYADHSDFEQTNTQLNFIPESVGAFALPSRNRMVLPVDLPDENLQRLIAHELTHVFQFEILFGGHYLRAATTNAPQWLVEGMASYFGNDEDNKDRMVLRDAVLADQVPEVASTGVGGYFAYRYGHAVFDFMTAEWGRDAVREFVFEFRTVIGPSIEKAVKRAFNISPEDFDIKFRRFLRQRYLKILTERGEPTDFGERFKVEDTPSAELSPRAYPSGDFIAAFSTYYVVVTLPGQREVAATMAQNQPPPPAEGAAEAPKMSEEDRSAIDTSMRLYQDLASARASPYNVGFGLLVLCAVGLVVIWLGLGLTYIGLVLVATAVAVPLALVGWTGAARVLLGVVALTAAFTALMQGLRVALSGPGPIMAVARNMLIEATRMKVSLVFIVILIFAMAALPGSLSPDTPLRYRVQSFLQYGSAGSFWIIAILVLFFSAASVAFEQRDKQIWQTMTKPVAAWQYILGKWLGVAGLAGALMIVCSAGVFLFTEYLRQQPAVGESAYLAPGQEGEAGPRLVEDRIILETQVLSARESVQAEIPFTADDANFLEGVKAYIADNRTRDPEFAQSAAMYDKVVSDLYKSVLMQWKSIDPGHYKPYLFRGLSAARNSGNPVTLRYRVDAGSNAPDQLYHITFVIGGLTYPSQDVTLGPTHSLSFLPSLINEKGEIEIIVHNSQVQFTEDNQPVVTPNAGTISIPVDGFELTYRAGSYQLNFLRVAFVLWIKLAFLAMLAIAAATFLSFPVACLVAFAVFLVAESTGFLSLSLEYYDAASNVVGGEGVVVKVIIWKSIVRAIGLAVAWMFKTYSELRPTGKLVDGRMLDWLSVAWGTCVLAAWSVVLYGASVLIFRRRELATYSGQ